MTDELDIEAIFARSKRDTKAIAEIDTRMPTSDWGQLQRDRRTLCAIVTRYLATLRDIAVNGNVDANGVTAQAKAYTTLHMGEPTGNNDPHNPVCNQ